MVIVSHQLIARNDMVLFLWRSSLELYYLVWQLLVKYKVNTPPLMENFRIATIEPPDVNLRPVILT